MSSLYLSGTTDAIKTERTARGNNHAECHVRGWHVGMEASAHSDTEGIVTCYASVTTGSGGDGASGPQLIAHHGGKVEVRLPYGNPYDLHDLIKFYEENVKS